MLMKVSKIYQVNFAFLFLWKTGCNAFLNGLNVIISNTNFFKLSLIAFCMISSTQYKSSKDVLVKRFFEEFLITSRFY